MNELFTQLKNEYKVSDPETQFKKMPKGDFVSVNTTDNEGNEVFLVAHKSAIRMLFGLEEVPDDRTLKLVDKGSKLDSNDREYRKVVLGDFTDRKSLKELDWLN